jgi:hypothetical protein
MHGQHQLGVHNGHATDSKVKRRPERRFGHFSILIMGK